MRDGVVVKASPSNVADLPSFRSGSLILLENVI